MTVSRAVVFCCDASARKGVGHLQRCATLARACESLGARAHILCRGDVGQLAARVAGDLALSFLDEDAPLEAELAALARLTAGAEPAALHVDHYRANAEYQARLVELGRPWMQIDYQRAHRFLGSWVVNLNPALPEDAYAGLLSERTTLLASPGFAVLRDEFVCTGRVSVGPLRRALLLFGGGDDLGLGEKVSRWLQARLPDVALDVVSTRLNPSLARLEALAAEGRLTLHQEPRSVAVLMRAADLALTTGGTATYELASQGTPFLALSVAENQRVIAEAWQRRGVALNLGDHAALSEALLGAALTRVEPPEVRHVMAEKGLAAVDGKGAERLARVLVEGAA